MSDYYGDSTLEDWLAEEVFSRKVVPPEVVALFEKWREGVERSIESWMESDDGEGNRLSWRGWGRGFYGVPDADEKEFDAAVERGKQLLANVRDQRRPAPDSSST